MNSTIKPDILFIKMCEKADNLQMLKNEDKDNCGLGAPVGNLGHCVKSCWFPSQKQMQNMIVKGVEKYVDATEKMTLDAKRKFVFNILMDAINNWAKIHKEFYTFDQIWLSYLMKYKFNKIWINEEWEND
jgi:hypothetical protein